MVKTEKAPPKKSLARNRSVREQRLAARQRARWLWLGLGFLASLFVAGAVFWPRSTTQEGNTARLADDPSLGPATAKVTIVEYGDFGCPTCRAWHHAGVLTEIRQTYGDQVRFVWRDFPVITAQSPKAAEAGQCAYDQSKFWEYHDMLYDRAPALSVDDLKSYAASLGLNTAKFNTCLDSGQHTATVDRSLQDAIQHGFRGTPSFLVNGKPVIGPPSFEYLRGLIDPIIAKGG